MDKKNLIIKYDKDLRMRIMYPEARREITGDVVRFIRKAPGMNFVSFTFASEPKLDVVIEKELAYFSPMNQPFTWKVYEHDMLPSLKNKLVSFGFGEDNDPADVMILDVIKARVDLSQSTEANIRRITTRDDLKDVVHVLDNVYGGHNKWVYDRLGMHMQFPGYLSVYAAYVDNEPVSAAWTYFPLGHFATLFGGSTIEKYRGRGLYTGLLQTRLAEIRKRGYAYAVVETGSMSGPIVRKHGFQKLTTVWDYEWQRS